MKMTKKKFGKMIRKAVQKANHKTFGVKRTPKKDEEEDHDLKDWDISIRHDLFYDDENDIEVGRYYLQTTDDPSVGIFGVQISPAFEKKEALKKWWKENKERIIKELSKDEVDWGKIEIR